MRLTELAQYCGYKGNVEYLVAAMAAGKREVYFGDSWFTGPRSATGLKVEFGHEYFGALKTNHGGTPKVEIERIMEKWNPGSHLVLECEEHGLWIMGYKYSHRKKGELIFSSLILLNVSAHRLSYHCSCSLCFSWHLGFGIFNTWTALHRQMAR